MYLDTNKSNECYGCFACKNACPVQAITLQEKEDTFLYPVIDIEKCINCNICRKVCPHTDKERRFFNYPSNCFAAINKNKEDFFKSSSGGAFKAIILSLEKILRDKYEKLYVCGAVFEQDFLVVHRIMEFSDSSSVDIFCKSKYVQSNPCNIYVDIKNLLSNEKNFVIFSGTPCQNAALYKYLGGRFANLFLIDLICKGAPSQALFDKYRSDLEKRYNSKLISYSFRNKEILDNGTLYTRSARYEFENGIVKKVTRFTDSFLKLFYEGQKYILRPACLECKFKIDKRVGDITIGDAWGIEKLYPELNPIQGVSVIILNTPVANQIVELLPDFLDIYECDYDFIVDNNSALGGEITHCANERECIKTLQKGIYDTGQTFAMCVEHFFEEVSSVNS